MIQLYTYFLRNRTSVLNQTFRTYLSTIYGNLPSIPARVKFKKGVIHLQALTSSKIGPHIEASPSLREFFLGKSWYTLLKIDENKSALNYEAQYKIDSSVFVSPENIIFSEQLYAIHSDIWEKFLAYLPNQEIVKLLGLKEHRHLWLAYSYAMTAQTHEEAIARAKFIGRYHFLLSVAFYQLEDLKKQNLPPEFQISVLKEIKHDLDRGMLKKQNFVNFHLSLNESMLSKLRHCPNLFDVSLLAALVFNYSKISFQSVDVKRQHSAIHRLPASNSDPRCFSSALHLARRLSKVSSRPGLLFFNSRSQWTKEPNLQSKYDPLSPYYFDALFSDLILRQVLLQAHHCSMVVDKSLIQIIRQRFESLFMQETGVHKFEELQSYWQHHAHYLKIFKSEHNERKFWSPLINPLKIENIQIVALASEEEVRQHGIKMHHCVQGDIFIQCCRELSADILELVSDTGEVSTLDIRPQFSGKYYILQHVGVGGVQKPSQHHLKVGLQLLEGINSGHLISKARQMMNLNQSVNPYQFDYDLDDWLTQEKIYQFYKTKKMLPSRLIFGNYRELLKHLNIENMINDVLETIKDEKSNAYSYHP